MLVVIFVERASTAATLRGCVVQGHAQAVVATIHQLLKPVFFLVCRLVSPTALTAVMG